MLRLSRFVDGEAVFRRVRLGKSPAEVDRIRREPSLSFSVDGEPRIIAHEENLVVTADGYELLTTRAPPEMPVVHR